MYDNFFQFKILQFIVTWKRCGNVKKKKVGEANVKEESSEEILLTGLGPSKSRKEKTSLHCNIRSQNGKRARKQATSSQEIMLRRLIGPSKNKRLVFIVIWEDKRTWKQATSSQEIMLRGLIGPRTNRKKITIWPNRKHSIMDVPAHDDAQQACYPTTCYSIIIIIHVSFDQENGKRVQ